MYWLRRIPAETRLVVLVVFLALFQALLLSAFGLRAIHGERQAVEEKLRDSAQNFLRQYVVAPSQNDLHDRADQVFLDAYRPDAVDWRERRPMPGRKVFTDAFTLRGDGAIFDSTGSILLLPRVVADKGNKAAREAAAELSTRVARGLVEESEKAGLDLAFAEEHPFARDEFGASLALLFADSPRLAQPEVDTPTLLRMRWVGVLNRIAGFLDGTEVERFVKRVDLAGAGRDGYKAGVTEQERRARVIRAVEAEAPRFSPVAQRELHRNVMADDNLPFYIRRVGTSNLRVLAMDSFIFRDFLDVIAGRAAARTSDGAFKPHIVDGVAAAEDVWVPIPALRGYVAATSISPDVVRERAGGRERFYWYIIAFSVAGILAGGIWTARTVMREVKLAKLKSGFVSNVSHELKTPLTSIRMFAEMLSSGKVTDDAEREECLSVITSETERLSRLIQQVLDFGRLQSRQRRFDWRIGSLRPLVESEAKRFLRATGLPADRLVLRIAVNLPAVHHDPDAFTEVFSNLLSNAHKYSPKDDKRIAVTLGPSHGRVVLAVDDNGPGVTPRERRRIFEQFYRTDDLLTREVEGTGLGLSIVRNIVRAHGGRVLVEDSELGGSRFVVILPAVARRRADSAAAPAETTRT